MDILLTITYINGDYDTFDVYISNGITENIYSSNIHKSQLLSGYQITGVSNDISQVKLISNSYGCNGNTTIINVEDSNYIYIEKISNNQYILHMRISTIIGSGPYQVVILPFSSGFGELTLSITSNNVLFLDFMNLSNTSLATINFYNNILDIQYILNYPNMTNVDISSLYLGINNGDNDILHEIGLNSSDNTTINNTEILNATKNYINITTTIQ